MTKVFISYSRKNTEYAKKIVDALRVHDLDAWVDWDDIPPTADWQEEIKKGIANADSFLFLLSPDSLASEVCDQEVDWAIENGKRLIPVIIVDLKLSLCATTSCLQAFIHDAKIGIQFSNSKPGYSTPSGFSINSLITLMERSIRIIRGFPLASMWFPAESKASTRE